MSKSTSRRVGRPAVNAIPITVRLAPGLLAPLDAEIAEQPDQPTRPEAIRRILAERYEGEDQ